MREPSPTGSSSDATAARRIARTSSSMLRPCLAARSRRPALTSSSRCRTTSCAIVISSCDINDITSEPGSQPCRSGCTLARPPALSSPRSGDNRELGMAPIERIEIMLVDLPPKVVRTDAIQAFVSQETPIVRVHGADGAVGTGYSYTIGTGGSSIVRLLHDHLAPELIGGDAEMIEQIWEALFFKSHATAVGAITSLALAAIDTALWDLRCRRAGLPLHLMAGGAQERVPLYTTEGGWLQLEPEALVEQALDAKARGFFGCKVKV